MLAFGLKSRRNLLQKAYQEKRAQPQKPGQSINVDLAFVPASRETVKKLPAVSGSSGRLVVEQMAEETEAVPQWPLAVCLMTTA